MTVIHNQSILAPLFELDTKDTVFPSREMGVFATNIRGNPARFIPPNSARVELVKCEEPIDLDNILLKILLMGSKQIGNYQITENLRNVAPNIDAKSVGNFVVVFPTRPVGRLCWDEGQKYGAALFEPELVQVVRIKPMKIPEKKKPSFNPILLDV